VTDVLQVVVNLALFDRLGYCTHPDDHSQPVEDVTRSIVLPLWNYCELIVWFGLAYVALSFLQDGGSFWSRFYFSAVTQLTIGYGDLTPLGWARLVAVAQGLIGWTLAVVVIARIVASLPPVRRAGGKT